MGKGIKPKFFTISGPSGVGKTTVFNEICESSLFKSGQLEAPVKISTRTSRLSDNVAEIKSVSLTDYKKLSAKEKMIEFNRHDYHYSVLFPKSMEEKIFFQVVPAEYAIIAKKKYKLEIDFYIIMLMAPSSLINSRRSSRCDNLSNDEVISRQETFEIESKVNYDYLVDASMPIADVVDNVLSIINDKR
ncbi:MAG: hypothetical protein ACRBBR_05285 [Cellvibrionaceae bacterium]